MSSPGQTGRRTSANRIHSSTPPLSRAIPSLGANNAADAFMHSLRDELRTDGQGATSRNQGTALTAGINRSNTAVRAVLGQPCLTGGQTGTVQPKHLPPGRTGLSNQFLGPVAQDQPGPVGQICPTSWLLLRSDSARPTTGRTRLFKHRSNCRVRLVNAGSA
ncbi:hypothetical protein PCASD_21276 [Puccinia coronata f. sp. avenae]|uniref:Uncharacterized protein n=1 Tax=Puccinia coronata f. sp. avenae TaxID=200324 RepID=A0A2N5TY24_9BASI|nr:hypothetical protein PCASD_21276 [Puccinia coronata f. sp. avenae]